MNYPFYIYPLLYAGMNYFSTSTGSYQINFFTSALYNLYGDFFIVVLVILFGLLLFTLGWRFIKRLWNL